jgi:hypothetical protein
MTRPADRATVRHALADQIERVPRPMPPPAAACGGLVGRDAAGTGGSDPRVPGGARMRTRGAEVL